MDKKKFFRLYANCIPVNGAMRSVICDLQRNSVKFIPNDLFNVLNAIEGQTFGEIIENYSLEDRETIKEYFSFLEKNQFGFWTDEPIFFPKLNAEWDIPSIISNVIIDINDQSRHPYEKICHELELLGCKGVQLRIYCCPTKEFVEDLLKQFRKGRIESIELVVGYNSNWKPEDYTELFKKFLRLNYLLVHTSDRNERIETDYGLIILSKQEVSSCGACGVVQSDYFVVNYEMFTESMRFNSCLNRKISIDENGLIKNCPSMSNNYGSIDKSSMLEAVEKKGFKNLWQINKDQIKVCKDCEFRYICTDCRAYVEDIDDKYSKPKKCAYNPYTAEWN